MFIRAKHWKYVLWKNRTKLYIKVTEGDETKSMENYIRRSLPHNLEAEKAVIGAMLMDREAIEKAIDIVTKEDFYESTYGILFESILEIYKEEKTVDLITLQNCLKDKKLPSEISSLEFAKELVEAVQTSANVKYYAEIVAEKALLRRLIQMSKEIETSCYLAKDPTNKILDNAEKNIFKVTQKRNTGNFVPMKAIVLETLEEIDAASKTHGNVTGLPTGFADLDYKLAGLHPANLVLVAARPGMGKTAFALNIVQYLAFKKEKHVAIFNLEMGKNELTKRLFALEGMVDSQALRTGNLKEEDWMKLVEAAGVIGKSNLIIDDSSDITISSMRSKCRKYKMEKGLDLIIIDYLQLMSGDGKNDSRQEVVAEISRSLKRLARELNIPIIALSQLNREAEKRTGHEPMLSDLRESGAIEQDADVVLFLYREDYYEKDSENKNLAKLKIAKQRNGALGTIDLVWLPQYTKFTDYRKN